MDEIKKKLYMLSPLQKKILEIFMREKTKLNVNRICESLVDEVYRTIIGRCHEIISERGIPEGCPITIIGNDSGLSPKNITLEEIELAIRKLRIDYKKSKIERDVLYAKLRFLKWFVHFPAFQKIRNETESLVKAGLLQKVPAADKKEKYVYCIDPVVADELRRLENEEQ